MGSNRERLVGEECETEGRPAAMFLACEAGIGSERLLRLLSSSLAVRRSPRTGIAVKESETGRGRAEDIIELPERTRRD